MVPLVCFGFHGPPVPVPPTFSLMEAILAAGSDRNESMTGDCAWFNETLALNVTNLEVRAGRLHVGIFSDPKPTRTQSKMIPRGDIYSFGLSIEVFQCVVSTLAGPDCDLRIVASPPAASVVSLNTRITKASNDQFYSKQQYEKDLGVQFQNHLMSNQASLSWNAQNWVALSQQCVELDKKQYFSIQIDDFVSELEVKYDCISNLTQSISDCEKFESKIKEERIPLLHLSYSALPGTYTSDYVGEPSTGSIIVSEPKRGLWYLAFFDPTVSSIQDNEGNVSEVVESRMCLKLSWRIKSCGPGLIGNNCQWNSVPFERIIKPQYESPFDSYYSPASQPDSTELWSEWVSLNSLFNASTWNFTLEQWAFAILKIPDGASGAVLSFDVKTSLSHFTEIYVRHEGCPANDNWEFHVREDGTQYLSISEVERLGLRMETDELQSLKNDKYRSLSLSIIYPMEGYWCIGMRFVPDLTEKRTTVSKSSEQDLNRELDLNQNEDWQHKWRRYFASYEGRFSFWTKALISGERKKNHDDNSNEGFNLGHANLLSGNDMLLRMTLHGCADKCSGHGDCQTNYEASRLYFFSYCHCDVRHGDIDCSALLLGLWYNLRQLLLLVFSNGAAILPSIWSLRQKAYSEWITFSLSGTASAIYHSCDAGGWCALSYSTLQFLDFWLSFLAIGMTCLYIAGFSGPTKAMLHISCAILTAAVAKEDATSGWSVLVVVLMGSIGLLLGWGLETHKMSFLLFKWRNSPAQGNVLGLHLFQRWAWSFYVQLRSRFHWPYLWLGLAFLLSALLGNRMELPETYWIWHSWWHVSIYTSAFILLYATRLEGGSSYVRDESAVYHVAGQEDDQDGITESHETFIMELDTIPESR